MTAKPSCANCGWSLSAHTPGTATDDTCGHFSLTAAPHLEFSLLEATDHRDSWTAYDPNEESMWMVKPMDDADWTVAYRLLPQEHELVVAEIRVYPTDPPGVYVTKPGDWSGEPTVVPQGGLPARKARPRIDDARKIANSLLRRYREKDPETLDANGQIGMRGIDEEKIEALNQPKQNRGLPDVVYARSAKAYLDAVDGKLGDGPPLRLASEALGIKESTLRGRLDVARGRGILTRPPRRGVSGGTLTKKGLHILKMIEEEE